MLSDNDFALLPVAAGPAYSRVSVSIEANKSLRLLVCELNRRTIRSKCCSSLEFGGPTAVPTRKLSLFASAALAFVSSSDSASIELTSISHVGYFAGAKSSHNLQHSYPIFK